MTGAGAGAAPAGRLHSYSLGFARQVRVRRMLALAGLEVTTGWPRSGGLVGVWGQRPVSHRGRWIAARAGAKLVTIEDGFLHSVGTGRGETISLVIDDTGIFFDARMPSRLEELIQCGVSHDPDETTRLIALLRARGLSKYTPATPRTASIEPCVLVVDQTAGDASIAGAEAGPEVFARMLDAARTENPGARIVVKTHPDVASGRKQGHFTPAMLRGDEVLHTAPTNPWDLLSAAQVVYTVSSQLGYEALLAGCSVRCFGAAFYAGWGLTQDETRQARRTAKPTVGDLFAACHLTYPVYYDPWRDRLCDFETACEVLSCQLRAETPTDGADGDVFVGARLWKRGNLRRFRPGRQSPRFARSVADARNLAKAENRRVWIWGAKFPTGTLDGLTQDGVPAGMVEDGFLRSVGLGAELTEAASLVFDRQGIYFDPSFPSDLEAWITRAAAGEGDEARASALVQRIVRGRVTKYNLPASTMPRPPDGCRVLLVPGQVEDDASIQRGCGQVRTNLDLLSRARADNPDAWIVYKPHPDVEAGLRAGQIPTASAAALADTVAVRASAPHLLEMADEVWTLTSLMGFEALLRGKQVTCLGTPFYAGWGLTRDLGPACPRRTARPTLEQLAWAALIAYPSYVDPASGLPCTPELVVERLTEGRPGRKAGLLSKLQALMASQSWIWR